MEQKFKMISTIAGDIEEKEKNVEEFEMEKEEKGRKIIWGHL